MQLKLSKTFKVIIFVLEDSNFKKLCFVEKTLLKKICSLFTVLDYHHTGRESVVLGCQEGIIKVNIVLNSNVWLFG